jgi:predicted AlkP superfamily pyrophosphatase or phosphodiesterase
MRSFVSRSVWVVLVVMGSWPVFAQPLRSVRTPHVIVVGLDGLSVDGVNKATSPHLHDLMARGAWTLEARGVMPTLSSPNWESAIGGAPPEQHGITSNGYFRRLVEFEPACHDGDGKYPTIFGVLREQNPSSRIAVFHEWAGFAELVERAAPDVMRHVAGTAHTVEAAMEYWQQDRPTLLFIHLDNIDHAGHETNWLTPTYYQAVTEADGYLGKVLDVIDRASAWDSTYVLVTSDHGGTRHGHGRNSLAEIQIPWILAGPGVVPGRITAPVNTYDTAATMAWIFNLEMPSCWTGRPVKSAFQPNVFLAGAGQ